MARSLTPLIKQMTKRQTRHGQTGRPRIGEDAAIYYVI